MFHPQNMILTGGSFVFSGEVTASAPACFDRDAIREFWHGFSCHCSTLRLTQTDALVFRIGEAEALPLEGNACSIHVTETGVCIAAGSEKDLLLGFMLLLDRIQPIDDEAGGTVLAIRCGRILEKPRLATRMIHYCVFPETELWELRKFLRFCAALRYSHVVVEFWGMLRFDCMAALGWPHAFTKEELRPLFREAEALGLEIVPMFNHWGHAAQSRMMHGKHVVLDQEPALASYFCANGWCWDVRKPKVRALMRSIRRELCELCGPSGYFHVGCDEAAGFDLDTQAGMDAICDYLNEIAEDMAAQGRRIIAWGDMFLYRHPHYDPRNTYTANAPTPHAEAYMLQRLDRRIIIADWQYDAKYAPVETSAVFTRAGFDCMICPWDRSVENVRACIGTAVADGLAGMIHTTWHTLSTGTPQAALSAVSCFEQEPPLDHYACAELMRKANFVAGGYRRAGWGKWQISVETF